MNRAFSKIWIIFILILILGGLILGCFSSLLRIPVFSDIFYQKRIGNLGIQSSPEAVQNLEQKLFKGPAPLMKPAGWVITDIEITDEELTSWVNLTCSEIRPLETKPLSVGKPERLPMAPEVPPEVPDVCSLFENFQIKFEEGKFIASAHIFKPIEADITIFGKILRGEKNEITLDLELGDTLIELGIEKVYLGNLPLPKMGIKRLIEEIELEIVKLNREFNEKYIRSARIDNLEILEGKIVFRGEIEISFAPPSRPITCSKNEDCGTDTCQQGRDKCVEIKHICEMGKCVSPAKVQEFPGFICQKDGKCRDTCGNGICDEPYEKLHCPQDCIEAIAPKDETANWKIYRIGYFQCGYIGYEIKYPSDLLVKGWEEPIERCPAATLYIVSFVKIKDSTRIEVLTIDTKADPDQLIYKSYEREGAISVKINETEGLKIKEDLFALSKSDKLYLISTENYSEVKNLFNQMLSTFRFLE